jgi:hypothetical protein
MMSKFFLAITFVVMFSGLAAAQGPPQQAGICFVDRSENCLIMPWIATQKCANAKCLKLPDGSLKCSRTNEGGPCPK